MAGINLQNELIKERKKLRFDNEQEVLTAFKSLFNAQKGESQKILERILGSNGEFNKLETDLLKTENIFHLNEIKSICIKYRLRFLDASKFKGEIPLEAIKKVDELQKEHNTELAGFKIIAPANMFRLQERDKDPLLFAPLGNGYFYLVHKWGNDLSFFRKALVYPFRNFESLFKSVIGLCAAIALSVPSEVMMGPLDKTSFNIRVIFFFYLFFAFAALTALYGFSRVKNFNENLWNSKYFS